MTRTARRISLRTAAPDYRIEAEARRIGDDVLVCIYGGDKPHIGAVAAAEPRPSLADPAAISATTSVLTYVGHKEDLVARETAETLAAALNTRVVVTAGIHWDDLTAAGIETVVARCREITRRLKQRLAD
jgi:gallate decarboxylase subunit D